MAQLKGGTYVGGDLIVATDLYASVLKSQVGTGTSPLSVLSTTKVTNLNVDSVDGQHFAWSNTDNTPTYLWGASTDGSSYLVSRTAMTVGYATLANGANGNFYIDDNYGNSVVGIYSASRFQGVYAMGDAYKLPADGTSPGSLYGMAWSHPNAGGQAANLSSHGLLLMENGTTMAALSTNIWCSGQFIGAGTGLTGTASSLSIGGNAATATNATNVSGGSVSSTGIISAADGFQFTAYLGNARNRIWSFGNSDGYGLSYFQGTSGYGGGDSIGMHFGTATSGESQFTFTPGGNFRASGNIYNSGNAVWHTGNFTPGNYSLTSHNHDGVYSPIGHNHDSTYLGINAIAASAYYLPTAYAGGVQTNPQIYFNNTIGLKAAMTGAAGTWSDTLWINGYSGGDVPWMCALHFARTSEPRMWISTQQSTATAYGTPQEVITAYNIGSQSVSNATTVANLAVHTARNNEVNKIVRTDASGYLQTGYINSSSGDENNASSPNRVWGTNGSDSYLRTYQTSSLSVGYAVTAGSATPSNDLDLVHITGTETITGTKTFSSIPKVQSSGNAYFAARSTGASTYANGLSVYDDGDTYQTQFGYDNQNNYSYLWGLGAFSINVGSYTNYHNEKEVARFTTEAFWLKDIGTTAATPSSGFGSFYINGDLPYFKSDAGNSYLMAMVYGTWNGSILTISGSGGYGIKADYQINTVLNGSKTANFTHDCKLGDVGAYQVNLAATTLGLHNLSSGMQGTVFLNFVTTTPTTLTVAAYSDAGSTALTVRTLGLVPTLAVNKSISVTYTCANDGTNTYVYIVYGKQS